MPLLTVTTASNFELICLWLTMKLWTDMPLVDNENNFKLRVDMPLVDNEKWLQIPTLLYLCLLVVNDFKFSRCYTSVSW